GRTRGLGRSLHDHQLAGRVVHPQVAGPRGRRVGAYHDVLDARAVRARVDARLDGERHARLERDRVALDDVRVLVRLKADTVAGAVDEPLAVAGVGDDPARRPVDALGGDAGLDADGGRFLGVVEDLEVLREFVRSAADRVGASAVGAVARRHRPADVNHDDVAVLDDPVGDLVVR